MTKDEWLSLDYTQRYFQNLEEEMEIIKDLFATGYFCDEGDLIHSGVLAIKATEAYKTIDKCVQIAKGTYIEEEEELVEE